MTASDSPYVTDVNDLAEAQERDRGTALRRELEQLRELIRPRTRKSPRTTIDKMLLLTLLAEAAGRGERQVNVADLADQLTVHGRLDRAPALNSIRKALIDLSDMIDDAYKEKPPTHHRARVESNGVIALEQTDQTTSETSFRALLESLPTVARELFPWGQTSHSFRAKWRYSDPVPRESTSAGAQYEWLSRVLDPNHVRSVSELDLRRIRELLYEVTSTTLAGVIHNLDRTVPIVAIEHHPTHKTDKWNDDLTWLNFAYRDYANRGGTIVRVVHFDPALHAETIDEKEWWQSWCDHIERRASGGERIAIVTGEPEPAWCRAVDGDYLVIVGRIVIRYEQLDFPRSFEGLPATAPAAAGINSAAERLARMPYTDSQSLTWLTDIVSLRHRLEEIRDKIRAAANGG